MRSDIGNLSKTYILKLNFNFLSFTVVWTKRILPTNISFKIKLTYSRYIDFIKCIYTMDSPRGRYAYNVLYKMYTNIKILS